MSVTPPDNPSTMDKFDKLQGKLRTDMDKLKTQIKSALSLRDNDTPAPPRTREAIEAEIDRLRLTNQWTAAAGEADLLLSLLGVGATAGAPPAGTLPSPLAPGMSFSASTPPPPQPLYTTSESTALAYTTLAQSCMVNYQVTAAHVYIDKALQADDGFMDAIFVRAMLELTKHHSSAPTSTSASPPASSTPLSAHPTIIVSPATPSIGVTIEGAAMPTTAFVNQPGVTPVKIVYPSGLSAPATPATTTAVTSSTPAAVLMTPISSTHSPMNTTTPSTPAGPSLSSVLTGPDRVTAQLSLSWLNRYRWQDNKSWLTLETRKRAPYRFRVLLDLLLSRGRLHELLGQYKEAAGQYGAVLSVCSVELKLEGDVADRVTYAQQRVPRMLLYAGNRADSLKVMRSVLISTPANYSPSMVSSLRHAYASLILRGFSSSDYTGIATNDSRAKPSSFTQEALFLLALSGQHSLVAMPAVPPSLHWHPFSPISLSHGSSSHAVYLSHSPVPLPLASTQPLGPGYRTIVSLDFSTSPTQSTLPQDEKERAERESCLTLARAGEYVVMAEMYRNLLSHQLESPQLWYKLCISLMAARQYNEAYLAITEALNRAPDYVMALLMAGKLCINFLDKAKEAVTYAAHALEVTQASTPVSPSLLDNPLAPFKAITTPPTPLSPSSGPSSPTSQHGRISNGPAQSAKPAVHALPAPPTFSFTSTSSNQLTLTPSLHASLLLSCQLLFAISCSKYAYSVSTFQNRKSLQRRALAVLQLAYKHSPSHHKLLFSLACLYADIREVGLSMSVVRQCLAIDRSHVQSWNLLALLLSAQKKYVEAVRACEGRRGKGCEVLVVTKARLLGEMGQFDEACKCMTELVSGAFHKDEYEVRESKGALKSRRPIFRQRKGQQPQAPSLQVLNIDDPTLFKADILLLLSHLYAQQYSTTTSGDAELLNDAYDCVHKCRAIAPSSLLPTIHAQLASLSLLSNSPSTALHHFESALALDSTHTPSLVGLASLYSQPPPPLTANLVLSYGYLTQALQIDATDHRAWYEMGRVLVAQGRGEEAVDQLMTAAELERTSPIISFGTVHRRV